jgi:hypothetical protein
MTPQTAERCGSESENFRSTTSRPLSGARGGVLSGLTAPNQPGTSSAPSCGRAPFTQQRPKENCCHHCVHVQ